GVGLMRIVDELYRAAATYSWDDLDDLPTKAGREALVRRVSEFLKMPFEVVGHEAATRPILVDRQPVIREMSPGVWAFNGLASKGALLAPHYAERLATLLASGGRQPPDSETPKNRGADAPRSPKTRLTERAPALISHGLH